MINKFNDTETQLEFNTIKCFMMNYPANHGVPQANSPGHSSQRQSI